MPETFTVELGGQTIDCHVPLFRTCTHAFLAYSRATGYRGPKVPRVEADDAEVSTVLAAIAAVCLPPDLGLPRPPRGMVSFEQWLSYGNDVERWVWRKRKKWLSGAAWSKATAAALDAVMDEAVGTEEAEDDIAAPFVDPAPDSSEE